MLRRASLAAALSLALASAGATYAHEQPAVSASPYPGVLKLHVDATDVAHRVFSVREEIPVSAGPMRLYYPQWLPGNHGPRGPVDLIGGLHFTANGQSLPWRRDPLDMYSFLVDVPAGASTLTAEFQYLSPFERTQGRVVMTPEIIGLQWNAVVLYPAGYDAGKITVEPSVQVPNNWHFGTALETGAINVTGSSATFKPTTLEILVDSPLLAGKYYKRFPLDESARPVYIDAVADKAKQLEIKPEILAKHKALVAQADKLYGSRHYNHYHFLASASERYSGIGLEHQQSTEVGVGNDYFTDEKALARSEVFAHEYSHSWDGKFRRGADLSTPHFNTPCRTACCGCTKARPSTGATCWLRARASAPPSRRATRSPPWPRPTTIAKAAPGVRSPIPPTSRSSPRACRRPGATGSAARTTTPKAS
jgi:predicted metalloprotease with PDZ domain